MVDKGMKEHHFIADNIAAITAAQQAADDAQADATQALADAAAAQAAADAAQADIDALYADGIGYSAGDGGSVTQLSNKSTTVTLNKLCGQITMHGANLAAGTSVTFSFSNSTIDTGDVLVLNHFSDGTAGAYSLNAQSDDGLANITVRNNTGSDLAEAIVIAFAVIKAVNS